MSINRTLIEAHDVLRQGASFIAEYVLNLKEASKNYIQNWTQCKVVQRGALQIILFHFWIVNVLQIPFTISSVKE